jgi:hypothetical protein
VPLVLNAATGTPETANWDEISNVLDDVPWIDLTSDLVAATWSVLGAPAYRVVGGIVEMRGLISSTTGEQSFLVSPFQNFPGGSFTDARPSVSRGIIGLYLSGGPLISYPAHVTIPSTGTALSFNAMGGGTGSAKSIFFDGLSWST